MPYAFLSAVDNEGPTSEYTVEIDQDLNYTFLLTEGDAERVEDHLPINSTDLPTITALSPDTAEVGSAVVTVTVTGTGFTDTTEVVFDGTPLATTVDSETSVSADIDPASATAGVFGVWVSVNVSESNIVDFTFTAPVEARSGKR